MPPSELNTPASAGKGCEQGLHGHLPCFELPRAELSCAIEVRGSELHPLAVAIVLRVQPMDDDSYMLARLCRVFRTLERMERERRPLTHYLLIDFKDSGLGSGSRQEEPAVGALRQLVSSMEDRILLCNLPSALRAQLDSTLVGAPAKVGDVIKLAKGWRAEFADFVRLPAPTKLYAQCIRANSEYITEGCRGRAQS